MGVETAKFFYTPSFVSGSMIAQREAYPRLIAKLASPEPNQTKVRLILIFSIF